jgi:hypothetical protein
MLPRSLCGVAPLPLLAGAIIRLDQSTQRHVLIGQMIPSTIPGRSLGTNPDGGNSFSAGIQAVPNNMSQIGNIAA